MEVSGQLHVFATLLLVSTEQKAAWASTSLDVLAKKHFLAFVWNCTTTPWMSSQQPSHYADYATLAPSLQYMDKRITTLHNSVPQTLHIITFPTL